MPHAIQNKIAVAVVIKNFCDQKRRTANYIDDYCGRNAQQNPRPPWIIIFLKRKYVYKMEEAETNGNRGQIRRLHKKFRQFQIWSGEIES